MLSIEQLHTRVGQIQALAEILELASRRGGPQDYAETALRDLLAIVWETARDVNPQIIRDAAAVTQPPERNGQQ